MKQEEYKSIHKRTPTNELPSISPHAIYIPAPKLKNIINEFSPSNTFHDTTWKDKESIK